MKLLETSDNRALIFNGGPFLELVLNTVEKGRNFEGKYSVTLEPWIEYEAPQLIKNGAFPNRYEFVIYNLIGEEYGETNKNNQILRTRSTFIYSNEGMNTEKEFFEQVLILTDNYTSSHFFTNLGKAKSKLWQLEPGIAATLEDFEFLLVKLGTKYRPFPQIDCKILFKV